MESESHEEVGDEEVESGAAGNESDMDLDLLAESESDSEESQVTRILIVGTVVKKDHLFTTVSISLINVNTWEFFGFLFQRYELIK